MCDTALAGSIAGLAVPGAGGGFSGPAELGAYGVMYAPTASVLGPAPEILVDVGLLGSSLSTRLDSWDETVTGGGISPVPGLAVSVPLGRFGIGAAFHVPYARGANGDPEGPQRFYSISSTLRLLEQDLTLSVRPVRFLVLGGGLRVGEFTYDATKGIDTGVIFNNTLPPELLLPVGDPLLEGTQSITAVSDTVFSFVAGAAFVSDFGHQLVVSFRPAWATRGDGGVAFVPSNSLVTSIEGDVNVELVMPAHLALAGRIEAGPLSLMPELEWVGWQRTGRNKANVTNLELLASDPLLDGLLGTAGLDQADFITSQEGELASDLHWHNVVNLGLAAAYEPTSSVELRAGAWYAPAAVESAWVHSANLDFTVLDLRAGVAWQAVPALRLAASADLLPGMTRTITDSVFTQSAPPTPQQGLPTANGRYAARLWRVGLTLVFRLPDISLGGS